MDFRIILQHQASEEAKVDRHNLDKQGTVYDTK